MLTHIKATRNKIHTAARRMRRGPLPECSLFRPVTHKTQTGCGMRLQYQLKGPQQRQMILVSGQTGHTKDKRFPKRRCRV